MNTADSSLQQFPSFPRSWIAAIVLHAVLLDGGRAAQASGIEIPGGPKSVVLQTPLAKPVELELTPLAPAAGAAEATSPAGTERVEAAQFGAVGELEKALSQAPAAPAAVLDRFFDAAAKPQLSERLAVQDKALQEASESASVTHVIFPSLTLDPEMIKEVKGVGRYELRPLSMILRAREPGVRVVYVTSRPVPEHLIDHVLRRVPDGAAIRKRVAFVNLEDGSEESIQEPLAKKLLRLAAEGASAKIQELKDAVAAAGAPAVLIPYTTTKFETAAAALLGIPVLGADPALAHWGTKSGSREIFRKAGLPLADGFENIRSLSELCAKIERLWGAHPGLRSAMLKVNDGISGEGNWRLELPPGDMTPEERRRAVEKLVLEIANRPGGKGRGFLAQFSAKGGIVEEFVESGTGASSPSGQGEILGPGQVRVVSTHEQRLDGGLYLGAHYPAEESHRRGVEAATRLVGEFLAREGVRGPFLVDFLSVSDGAGGPRLVPIEINVRSGGTTYPFVAASHLTRASVGPDGLLRRPDGGPVVYSALDHAKAPGLAGVAVKEVLDSLEASGVLYDEKRGSGALFYMLRDRIQADGNVGFLVIASDRAEAERLERRVKDLLAGLEKRVSRPS